MRFDNGDRIREGLPFQMVVRDDKIHPEFTNALRLPDRRDPVVHGDDEVGPELGDIRPLGFQIGVEQCSGCDSVTVVVPIDTDAFPRKDGLVDPVDRLLHIREEKRVLPFRGLREKGVHRFRGVDAPFDQEQSRKGIDGIPLRDL